MISVFIFNSDGTKIFIGKKYDESFWSILGSKLDYGENFEDCAARILSCVTNILVEDNSRVKFVCSYNAVDKSKNIHIVAVDYMIQITKEEEKFYFMIDPFHFQTWNWFSYEELIKMQDNLFISVQVFLKKFNIKKLDDIKSLISN
jgi:ADP-ribose pyrophosphatase YjhB (NUDIX family)